MRGSAYCKANFFTDMQTIIKRGKTADYTIISNIATRDSRLTWKAKGLLAYIMGLPEDWKINIADLASKSKDGRDATARALNELIEMGYAVRKRLIGENGRFEGYCYTVTDIPETDITTDGNTIDGKSVNGFSINGKSINGKSIYGKCQTTNNINNKEINTKETLFGEKEFSPHTPTATPEINFDVEVNDPITVTSETTPPSSAAAPLNDEASPNKKTLFRNSAAADRDVFFKTFGGDEYKTLDMEYYYQAVSDWSDSSNTKRTARGWFATVRTFIRGDKEKKRLHTKQQAQGRFNLEGAIKFLKNDFS